MRRIQYTLLGDGRSDRILHCPIQWAIRRLGCGIEIANWADFSCLDTPPKSLADRLGLAIELYPADVYFIHRDAEAVGLETRLREIRAAAGCRVLAVPVIPVRMTEAWFLHDESAIRNVSGNPRGTAPLLLPPLRRLEELPDPKATLSAALLTATGLSGRRLEKAKRQLPHARFLLDQWIKDFEPLFALPAFSSFYRELEAVMQAGGFIEDHPR